VLSRRMRVNRAASYAGYFPLGNAASTQHGLFDADRVTNLCCHDRAKIVLVIDVMRVE
jgi:hypothetical protein